MGAPRENTFGKDLADQVLKDHSLMCKAAWNIFQSCWGEQAGILIGV